MTRRRVLPGALLGLLVTFVAPNVAIGTSTEQEAILGLLTTTAERVDAGERTAASEALVEIAAMREAVTPACEGWLSIAEGWVRLVALAETTTDERDRGALRMGAYTIARSDLRTKAEYDCLIAP